MKLKLASRPVVALLFALSHALAWGEGTLTHMSGPVSVHKADGTLLPAALGTRVHAGDSVATGAGGYVRVEMTDGGEMVLRPDSQLKVDSYKFVAAKPAEDSFVFHMLKGGLRTVTGLIGKRGNRDAYVLKTQTATIGIRGTQFDLRVCLANCGALADGTYLAVRFGAVQTTNAQGSLAVAAGQVAYVPPQRPPVMLPRDPGIGFTPPAVIPKLDEKKKQQAAPAAAATPDAGAKPAAASGQTQRSGQAAAASSSPDSAEGSGKAEGSASNTASKDANGADAGGKVGGEAASSDSSSGAASVPASTAAATPSAESPASAAPISSAPQSARTDCSVQ